MLIVAERRSIPWASQPNPSITYVSAGENRPTAISEASHPPAPSCWKLRNWFNSSTRGATMAHQLARSKKPAADCLSRLTHGTRVHRERHENYISPNPKPAALPELLRDGWHRSAHGLPADPGQSWRARIGSARMEPSRVGRSPHMGFVCLHHACGGASRDQLGVAHQGRRQGSRLASWSRTARRRPDYWHFPFAPDYQTSGRNRQKTRDNLSCLTGKRIHSCVIGIK